MKIKEKSVMIRKSLLSVLAGAVVCCFAAAPVGA